MFAEVGDLLFTVVNVARVVNVDPELALRATSGAVRRRVELAERIAAEGGETWAELDLDGAGALVRAGQGSLRTRPSKPGEEAARADAAGALRHATLRCNI